jgi:predicted nucleic acid-binding protein
MERVVLDTSVSVAGLRSRLGASNALLRLAAKRMILPLATTSLLREIDQVLFDLASVMRPVEAHYTSRPQLDDADDEMVLEVAVNGRAQWLATHNMRDIAIAAARFDIEAIRPGDLVKRILQ